MERGGTAITCRASAKLISWWPVTLPSTWTLPCEIQERVSRKTLQDSSTSRSIPSIWRPTWCDATRPLESNRRAGSAAVVWPHKGHEGIFGMLTFKFHIAQNSRKRNGCFRLILRFLSTMYWIFGPQSIRGESSRNQNCTFWFTL